MSIKWTVKSAGVTIPAPATDKEIGKAKNILRKASKGFNDIYQSRGL